MNDAELARLTADIAELARLAENADLAPAQLADIFTTIAADSGAIADLARLTADIAELARLADAARLTADLAENVYTITADLGAVQRFEATFATIADLAPAQLADIFATIAADNVEVVTTELVRILADVDNAELVRILADVELANVDNAELVRILADVEFADVELGYAIAELARMTAEVHADVEDESAELARRFDAIYHDKPARPIALPADVRKRTAADIDKSDLVRLLVKVHADVEAESADPARLLAYIDNAELVRLLARRLAKPRQAARRRFRRRSQDRLAEIERRLHAKERQRSVDSRPVTLPADVCERIIAERADGRTLQAIADDLNAENVPTLRWGRLRWDPSTIARVGHDLVMWPPKHRP